MVSSRPRGVTASSVSQAKLAVDLEIARRLNWTSGDYVVNEHEHEHDLLCDCCFFTYDRRFALLLLLLFLPWRVVGVIDFVFGLMCVSVLKELHFSSLFRQLLVRHVRTGERHRGEPQRRHVGAARLDINTPEPADTRHTSFIHSRTKI